MKNKTSTPTNPIATNAIFLTPNDNDNTTSMIYDMMLLVIETTKMNTMHRRININIKQILFAYFLYNWGIIAVCSLLLLPTDSIQICGGKAGRG